jgi:hypothetical protein
VNRGDRSISTRPWRFVSLEPRFCARKYRVGDEGEPEPINPAHLTDVLDSLAQARRRQFATDAEIEAAFRRFDQ